MRRILLAALLFAPLAPASAADEPWTPKGCAKPAYQNENHRWVCVTNDGFVRRISDYSDKALREDRQVKLTFGISTDRLGVTTPAGTLGASSGEGEFLGAFLTGVRTWLDSKPGTHQFNARLGVGQQASFRALTDNPAAFTEGEQFAYWGSRTPGIQTTDSMSLSFEVRPRLGGERSRWRVGTQFALSRSVNVNTTSAQERISVTDVTVSPFSPRAVAVEGNFSRSYHAEEFNTHVGAWQITLGPEYELIHEGPVDLSVEAGYAYFNFTRRSSSRLSQSSYILFAPELFVPDVDPVKLLEGGETPAYTDSNASHNRHQVYVGARAEVYPFQRRLGFGLGVRWYARGLPFAHTFTPALFGSFDESARTRHWVASASVTLGFPFSE